MLDTASNAADLRDAVRAIGHAGNAMDKLTPELAYTLLGAIFLHVINRLPPPERSGAILALIAIAEAVAEDA